MARGGKRPGAGRRKGPIRSTAIARSIGPIENLSAAARMHTREALAVLEAVMVDERCSGSARAMAAIALLDRGWGRSPLVIEHGGQIEVTPVSEIEIARRIMFLLEKARKRLPNG